MVLVQAKWYYYILLGLVDVEAKFLGKCFQWKRHSITWRAFLKIEVNILVFNLLKQQQVREELEFHEEPIGLNFNCPNLDYFSIT